MEEAQPGAAASNSVPSSAEIMNAAVSADASPSSTHMRVAQVAATHDKFNATIIWHNTDSRSNFTMFRKESTGPIERILVDFAAVLESGIIDQIIRVNASKHLFCVTLATKKNKEDVIDQILAVL